MEWLFRVQRIIPFAAFVALSLTQPANPQLSNRAWLAQPIDVPAEVREQYQGVAAKRSLLIPLPPLVDSEMDPTDQSLQQTYSLEKVFSIAANKVGLSSQDALNQMLVRAAAPSPRNLPPFGAVDFRNVPLFSSFQLLAIVNRLDFAQKVGSKWKNQELRFVYGMKPSGQARFTLIVEFKLPPMDWPAFRKEAEDWKSLKSAPASSFPVALRTLIDNSLFQQGPLTRIRTNCMVGGGQWRFSQWEFHQGKLVQTDLSFQMAGPYADDGGGGRSEEVRNRIRRFQTFFETENGKPIGSVDLAKLGAMSTQTRQYSADDKALNPPAEVTYSTKLAELRNQIGTQQCNGCHSAETGTNLQHISDNVHSHVSGFLAPDPTNWDSPLETLSTKVVNVGYCVRESSESTSLGVMEPIACPDRDRIKQVQITEQRKFNDLARRKLFMASILALPKDQEPSLEDIQQIMNYAPNFVH